MLDLTRSAAGFHAKAVRRNDKNDDTICGIIHDSINGIVDGATSSLIFRWVKNFGYF